MYPQENHWFPNTASKFHKENQNNFVLTGVKRDVCKLKFTNCFQMNNMVHLRSILKNAYITPSKKQIVYFMNLLDVAN